MNYQQFRVFGKQVGSKSQQAKESAKSNTQDAKKDHDDNEGVDQHYEQTMTKPMAIPKIKISFDEEETKKAGWQKGFSSLIKPQNSATAHPQKTPLKSPSSPKAMPIAHPPATPQPPMLQIPYNPQIQEILSKKPLRQRLQPLLPSQLLLPISFDHQQLLHRMQLIDRTIEFLSQHRNIKVFYFDNVRKNIFQTHTIVIQLKMLQQLIFLDEGIYGLEWALNQKNNKWDIKITMPKVDSGDRRKAEMRKKIVNYMILKEGEFLLQNNLTKVQQFKWHQKFEYKKIQIPQKSLPIHPNQSNSDLRNLPCCQLQKIRNPTLKHLLTQKKHTEQQHSHTSSTIANMIFSKTPTSQITSKLLQIVKQKQQFQNKLSSSECIHTNPGKKIDKEALFKIYDQVLMVFMARNVSNMFKVTLLEILESRLQIKNQIIREYLDKLLGIQKGEKGGFLKVVLSSKKLEVVQIDRTHYKTDREKVQKIVE